MKNFSMLAKTFKGLEEVLAQELIELGANDVLIERRAVSFSGDKALLYRVNFSLRTALRVLVPVASFKAKDTDALYEQLKRLNWSKYMTADNTFAIDATVYSEYFRNSRFVTYRVKDAIVDYWMEKAHKRPNVQVQDPDIQLNVHISGEQVTVSLDSSGESLHKRGYRVATTEAPINEVLAAGLLRMAGWKGQSDFYDPMCGSGTFLVEAALMARNIAPGVFRKSFAFENGRTLMPICGARSIMTTPMNASLPIRYTARTLRSMRFNRLRRMSSRPVCRKMWNCVKCGWKN